MVLGDNEHYKHAEMTIESGPNGEVNHVVVVTTDLVLDPADKAYSKPEVDRFMAEVEAYKKSNGHVKKVIVVHGH